MQVMACCQPCSSSAVVASAPLEGREEGDDKKYRPESDSERQFVLPGANGFLIRSFM